MRYSLVVYLKDRYYEIKGYSKIPGFEHLDEKKLKDIVSFTNEFNCEEQLISYLIETNLLPREFYHGTLGIYYYKGKDAIPNVLDYGISFSEDKKFFDTIFLQYYFSKKIINIEFMCAFINTFYQKLKDINIFSESLNYINDSFKSFKQYGMLLPQTDEYMEKFIKFYCTKLSKGNYPKANFRRIRDLAMFAINYERNFERNYERNFERDIPDKPKRSKEEIKMLINHYQSIINNNMLNEEEFEAYNSTISNLEKELEIVKLGNYGNDMNLNRRLN